MTPKKIAILGGGVAGCTAAYWLSHPDLGGQYEVTLFQNGWRLGGKGASGHNQEQSFRSEEHGLHVWFGFYQNAFKVLRGAYNEAGANGPFVTIDDVFKAQSQGVIAQADGSAGYDFWVYDFPEGDHAPGDNHPPPDLGAQIARAINWVVLNFRRLLTEWNGRWPILASLESAVLVFVQILEQNLANVGALVPNAGQSAALGAVVDILRKMRTLVHALIALIDILPGKQSESERLLRMLDLGLTCMIGLYDGGVLDPPAGFDKFDNVEYREWLRLHGAYYHDLESGSIKALYDLPFAYCNGICDDAHANISAGVALRSAARLFFGYKGAFVYKMQLGMGEAVFVPLYETLKKRGVKFKFFHRVKNLGLSPQKDSVDSFTAYEQTRLKGAEYDPLISIAHTSGQQLRVWPTGPKRDQLDPTSPLPQPDQPGFESDWCAVKGEERRFTVGPGKQFDEVVLATPVATFPALASELMQASNAWRDMTRRIQTIRTQGVQLWLNEPLATLGWRARGAIEPPLVDGYVDDLNTWMDQSAILATEQWTGVVPQSLVYFCGPMPDDPNQAPVTDVRYPATQTAAIAQQFRDWAKRAIGPMWPQATNANGDLNPARVVDTYYRANIDASERYVLSVTGSSRYRLAAGDSGFANLYLAGDWTRNGLNVGCVEAAAMSGAQAAREIANFPLKIDGETDF